MSDDIYKIPDLIAKKITARDFTFIAKNAIRVCIITPMPFVETPASKRFEEKEGVNFRAIDIRWEEDDE